MLLPIIPTWRDHRIAALDKLLGSALQRMVFSSGYHADGDGGGGTFYWDPASTETANGGTIYGTLPLGRWKRDYSGPVSVRWFGARGDGVTPDQVAIRAAIAAAIAAGDGEVYFPPGDYLCTDTISITTDPWYAAGSGLVQQFVGLSGAGTRSTRLLFDMNTTKDGLVFSCNTAGSPPVSTYGLGGFVRDMDIIGVDYDRARDLIKINGWGDINFRNVRATNCARYALNIWDGYHTTFCDCLFGGSGDAGVYIDGTGPTTSTRFYGCYFNTVRNGPGVSVAGGGIQFDACIFESNGIVTPAVGAGIVVREGTVTLNGPYFENNAGWCMELGTVAAASVVVTNPSCTPGALTSGTRGVLRGGPYLRYGALIGGRYSSFAHPIVMEAGSAGFCIFGTDGYGGGQGPEYIYGSGSIQDYPGLVHYQDPTSGDQLLSGRFIVNGYGSAPDPVVVTSSPHSATGDREIYLVTVAGVVTINLPDHTNPSANLFNGRRVTVVDDRGSAGTAGQEIVIQGNGRNINGASSYTINTNYGRVTMVYNLANTRWTIVA